MEDLKVQSPCTQLEKARASLSTMSDTIVRFAVSLVLFLQDLASGFVFGEVLHNCNLQPDFSQFEDSRTPTAVFNNYRRLQVVLVT